MRTTTVVAGLVLGAIGLGAGCRKDKGQVSADRTREDLRAQSEGQLRVDQSAVLPVDVRAGVQREYPGSTVQNVTKKTFQDRTVRYQVDLTTKDGKRVSREFDNKGQVSKG